MKRGALALMLVTWCTLMALLAVVVAMLGVAPSADAVLPGRSGNIAVVVSESSRSGFGGAEITLMDRDGRVRRNFARCTGGFDGPPTGRCPDTPAYSANGSQIAYGSRSLSEAVNAPRFGRSRLAIANADGSNSRLLPPLTSDDSEPVWSPGGLLAFTGVLNGRKNVFIVKSDGTGLHQLTFAGGRAPAWSSRNRIAFVRGGGEFRDGRIYTINPDGTNRVRLRLGDQPDFSPSGRRIIYQRALPVRRSQRVRRSSHTTGRRVRLYIMRSRRNFRRFTRGSGREPSWSPGGGTIAFGRLIEPRTLDSTDDLFRVGVNRRGLRRIFSGEFGSDLISANDPAWQPLP